MTSFHTSRNAIVGTGDYLPVHRVSNQELVDRLASLSVETSSEWIQSRTGIEFRHHANHTETTTFMATQAAKAALAAAGVSAQDVHLIIVATSTPDQAFPSTACGVQGAIGAAGSIAFDVSAACSGFVYALTVADAMMKAGLAKTALVIGAEVFSRLMDWQDRSTCVLFGDGAGAVVLQARQHSEDAHSGTHSGILGSHLSADGQVRDILYTGAHIAGGKVQGFPFLRMDGQAVFKQAVQVLADSALQLCQQLNFAPSDVDWLVPHQANVRILQAVAKRLHVDESRIVVTVNQHGNTSAASVPLALHHARKTGKLLPGQRALLQGVGAGFTWGSVLVQF